MNSPDSEGVIQFRLKKLDTYRKGFNEEACGDGLIKWRRLLIKLGWIGQDPERYGGLGFGNISTRVGSKTVDPDRRRFLISGSQTGGLLHFSRGDCAIVTRFSLKDHSLTYFGDCRPSSEALSHAAVYAARPCAFACIHVHCPTIWRHRHVVADLCIPVHSKYGSADMSQGIYDALKLDKSNGPTLLAMSGHQDGVIAFGRDFKMAFGRLVEAYLTAAV